MSSSLIEIFRLGPDRPTHISIDTIPAEMNSALFTLRQILPQEKELAVSLAESIRKSPDVQPFLLANLSPFLLSLLVRDVLLDKPNLSIESYSSIETLATIFSMIAPKHLSSYSAADTLKKIIPGPSTEFLGPQPPILKEKSASLSTFLEQHVVLMKLVAWNAPLLTKDAIRDIFVLCSMTLGLAPIEGTKFESGLFNKKDFEPVTMLSLDLSPVFIYMMAWVLTQLHCLKIESSLAPMFLNKLREKAYNENMFELIAEFDGMALICEDGIPL